MGDLADVGGQPCRQSAALASTTGSILFSFYPDLDNIGGSAYTRADGNSLGRTIVNTGAAFHACIKINNMGLILPHFINCLGTDFGAQAAADAFFFIEYQA